MLKIRDMPPQIDAGLLGRLADVRTATVGHFRWWGFVDPALRPLLKERRIAGTAVTAAIPANDSSVVQYLLDQLRPGDVLVIDKLGDRRHACIGGVLALAAKEAGAAGIILDGVACDFDEIRNYGLPMWCRGETALTDKLLVVAGAANIPVSCGGAAVCPGDAILADDDGIVVLSRDEIEETIDTAMPMQGGEVDRVSRIRAGEKIGAIIGTTAKVTAALQKP